MHDSLSIISSSLTPIAKDIALAIVTGIYSGVIVAKYTEFRNLREEGSRILHRGLTAKECSQELGLISNSLSRLGHKSSADAIHRIADEYRRLQSDNQIIDDDGNVTLPSIGDAFGIINKSAELRSKVNGLRPSWLFIILPIV